MVGNIPVFDNVTGTLLGASGLNSTPGAILPITDDAFNLGEDDTTSLRFNTLYLSRGIEIYSSDLSPTQPWLQLSTDLVLGRAELVYNDPNTGDDFTLSTDTTLPNQIGIYFNRTTPICAFDSSGNVQLKSLGGGLQITEGANASMGRATLVGGTVVVSTTKVTANSRIFLTAQNSGGTPGFVRVSARSAGVSFTILSSNALDTSDIAWMIVEPL